MKKKTAFAVLIVICLTLLVACNKSIPTVTTVDYTDEAGVMYTLYMTEKNGTTEETVKVTGYVGPTVGGVTGRIIDVEIASVVTIEGREYPVTEVANTAFYRADVTQITVGDNVVEIGDFAFASCGAGEIIFPKSVKRLGSFACVNCNALRIVRFYSDQPPTVGECAFMFYSSDKNVYEPAQNLTIRVPSGSKNAYLDEWKEYGGIIK